MNYTSDSADAISVFFTDSQFQDISRKCLVGNCENLGIRHKTFRKEKSGGSSDHNRGWFVGKCWSDHFLTTVSLVAFVRRQNNPDFKLWLSFSRLWVLIIFSVSDTMIIWEEVVGQVRWNLETKLATAKLELFHSTNKLRNYITKQLHLGFN